MQSQEKMKKTNKQEGQTKIIGGYRCRNQNEKAHSQTKLSNSEALFYSQDAKQQVIFRKDVNTKYLKSQVEKISQRISLKENALTL